MKIVRLLLHFFIAAVVCACVAIFLHTQMVLAALTQIDISVSIADRFYMSIQDILGLLPAYGTIILVGLAIAFSIAKLWRKFLPTTPMLLYPLAGSLALLVILMSMQPILNITLLAGARTGAGLALQVLAGALGGFLFAYLRKPNHSAN